MKLPVLLRRVGTYFDNENPRLAVAGSVALVIAGNQPFYPLYVYAIVGGQAWPTLLTWFSTPFFLLVPALCRRSPLAGRLLLVVASIGNTMVTACALGAASLVELFYIPCLALAPLLFRRSEAKIGYLVCITGVLIGLAVIHGGLGKGLVFFDSAELRSLGKLHVFSIISLLFLFGFFAWRLRRREAG